MCSEPRGSLHVSVYVEELKKTISIRIYSARHRNESGGSQMEIRTLPTNVLDREIKWNFFIISRIGCHAPSHGLFSSAVM
jgi:hypothetical protein